MRRVIVGTFVSLDGVMQAPGGPDEDRSGGFQHGGWQMSYFDDASGQAISEGMARIDGFLIGRKTYEIMAPYWPNQPEDNPIASQMNRLAKYVVSTTLTEPLEWQNSTLIKGDVAEEIRNLKREPGKDLSVLGSGALAQTLMQHGLVDEYQIMVHPLILGSGKRLFGNGIPKIPLELIDTKTTATGVVILTYRPVEPVGA
jgi:dihydrofolate reductase